MLGLALSVMLAASPPLPPFFEDDPLFSLLPGGAPASLVCTNNLFGSLGETVTTTRASVRSCQCSSSTLRILAANEPCIEPGGVSVWGDHQNLLARSAEFDQSPWFAISATVTPNTHTAPDGTLTADTVAITAADGRVFQAATITGASGAVSLWARALSGTQTFTLILRDDTTGNIPIQQNFVATTAWQRVSASSSSLVSGNPYSVRIYGAGIGSGLTGSLVVWGAQVNPTLVTAPYCPSGATAPVTCLATTHTVATTGWPTSSGRVCLRYAPRSATPGASNHLDTRSGTGGVLLHTGADNSLRLLIQDGAGATSLTFSAALTWVADRPYLLCGEWDAGNAYVSRDGERVGSTVGTAKTPPRHNATAYVGASGTGTGHVNGNISDLEVRQ